MQKNDSRTLTNFVLMALLSAVVLFAAFQPERIKQWAGLSQPMTLPKADCDLAQGPCRYDLPEGAGSLTLDLLPRPLQAVDPMTASVTLTGVEASAVLIDFAGVDMNMGFNQISLPRANTDVFTGQASLPACISGKMTWIATLQVQTRRQQYNIPFHFVVGE